MNDQMKDDGRSSKWPVMSSALSGLLYLLMGPSLAMADVNDRYPSFSLSGYIMFDYHHLNGIEPEDDQPEVGEIRRARFNINSILHSRWSLKIQAHYNTPNRNEAHHLEWKDIYIKYRSGDDYFIQFGQFDPPIGLENDISSQQLPTLERSMTSEVISLPSSLGAMIGYYRKRWTLTSGYFDASDEDKSVYDFVTRATTNIKFNSNHRLHLGANTAQRDWKSGTYDIRERPEINTANNPIISPVFDVKKVQTYSTEWAWQWENVTAQGEWFIQNITNMHQQSQSDVQYDGYYVQLSGLTHAKRRYKNGRFTKLNNKQGKSAFEGVVRYSELDVFDRDIGTVAEVFTTGLNYYYAQGLKAMLSYTHIEWRRPATGVIRKGNTWSGRIQFSF